MIPIVFPVDEAGCKGTGAGDALTAGRDIVAAADPGPGEAPLAGRDMVEDDGAGAGVPLPATGRNPVAVAKPGVAALIAGRDAVADAEAGVAPPAAARNPVADAAAGDIIFGPALPVAVAEGATDGAAPAPDAGTSVVPHCTQNFAPG